MLVANSLIVGHHRSEIWIHALVLLLMAVFVSIYLGLGYFRLTSG